MGLTRAQKHNRMLDRVFSNYEKNKKDPTIKSFHRKQEKLGNAHHYMGDQYPGKGPKFKALKAKIDN